jgi:hypothetical protein
MAIRLRASAVSGLRARRKKRPDSRGARLSKGIC